jgi:hypothetical protein
LKGIDFLNHIFTLPLFQCGMIVLKGDKVLYEIKGHFLFPNPYLFICKIINPGNLPTINYKLNTINYILLTINYL